MKYLRKKGEKCNIFSGYVENDPSPNILYTEFHMSYFLKYNPNFDPCKIKHGDIVIIKNPSYYVMPEIAIYALDYPLDTYLFELKFLKTCNNFKHIPYSITRWIKDDPEDFYSNFTNKEYKNIMQM